MRALKYLKPSYWKFRKKAESIVQKAVLELNLERKGNRITFQNFEEAYQFVLSVGDYIRFTRVSPIGLFVFIEFEYLESRRTLSPERTLMLNLYQALREVFEKHIGWEYVEDVVGRYVLIEEEDYTFQVILLVQGLSLVKRFRNKRYIRVDGIGFFHVDFGNCTLSTNLEKPVTEVVPQSPMRDLLAIAYYFLRFRKD